MFQAKQSAKSKIVVILAIAALSGCAPLSTAPGGYRGAPAVVQATPGKAVIYLVRTRPDTSDLTAPLTLDEQPIGATFAGTYMRLEVAPGQHRIAGQFSDGGAINVSVGADRIYFLQHSVAGSRRAPNPRSFFTMLDEPRGRAALARAPERAGWGT